MCNLYSMTKSQGELRALVKALRDRKINLPSLPGIFPDKFAPVIRHDDDRLALAMLRWGMPTPPMYQKPGAIDRGVTNIRNSSSRHWQAWLKREHRCLVPVTSFCEPTDNPNPATGKKDWVWFALSEERPIFFFAGIWTKWKGLRGTKSKPEDGEHELFGFLTTDPAPDVKPIHSKATPAILTTPDHCEIWLNAPKEEALALQRPAPAGTLMIVARGEEKEDMAGMVP